MIQVTVRFFILTKFQKYGKKGENQPTLLYTLISNLCTFTYIQLVGRISEESGELEGGMEVNQISGLFNRNTYQMVATFRNALFFQGLLIAQRGRGGVVSCSSYYFWCIFPLEHSVARFK